MWTLAGAISGTPQTGLTDPTYTVTEGIAPTYNGKQHLVSALGGTQADVLVNTPSNPFTITLVRPTQLKSVAALKSNSNTLVANNRNKYMIISRKAGLLIPSGSVYGQDVFRLELDCAAGMDTADPAQRRAHVSFLLGCLNANSALLGDLLCNGT